MRMAKLPAELKTRGGGPLWPGATRNPVGRFGPGKRGQNGVAPGHGVDFFRVGIVLGFSLGVLAL